jgi:hypothetical protein
VRRPARGRRKWRARAILVLWATLAATTFPASPPLEAQAGRPLSGYYLNALVATGESELVEPGVLSFQRIRLAALLRWEGLAIAAAYEQRFTARLDGARPGPWPSGAARHGPWSGGADRAGPWPGGAGVERGWLPLDGPLLERGRISWTHGLDRLSVAFDLGEGARVTVGRQPISWATTLYLTPTDPFVPFDPADPFREFRAGVDAARVVVATGPLSQVEAVVRIAAGVDGDETVTALARVQRLVGEVEVTAWGGAVHGDPAVALGLTGSAGGWALRGAGVARSTGAGGVVRFALGVDRRFALAGRDLRLLLEYQRDGYGASGPDQLVPVAGSVERLRGELQTLARDAMAANASWQIHPLVEVGTFALVNLGDGSALLAPVVTRSLGDETSLRLGGVLGTGPGARRADGATSPVPRSEHGGLPPAGFAALTWYF